MASATATASPTMGTSHDPHDRYAGIFTPAASSSTDDGAHRQPLTFVTPGFETRTLIDSLYAVPVAGVGDPRFMAAYCVNLERLSVQAHRTAGVAAALQATAVAVNGAAATPGCLGGALSALIGPGRGEEEEYVVAAFLEDVDKLEALVKTLLALEFWRENVVFGGAAAATASTEEETEEAEEVDFEIEGGERGEEEAAQYRDLNEVDGAGEARGAVGHGSESETQAEGLAPRLAANGNALRTAFILHAETTIVSLLSLIFYQGIPAGLLEGSQGDEALLSLVDYCARQLAFLGAPEDSNPTLSRQKNPLPTSQLASYLQARSRVDEIRDSLRDAAYQTAIATVALSRHLCENAHELGPGLLGRLLEVHDFPLLLVPLVEEPPWTRRRVVERRSNDDDRGSVTTRTVWEKLDEHNEWKEVPSAELLRVTQLEGQPWLALFHLTTNKACREAYGLDEYRKSQLLRLRKYVHDALTDQLPVLGEVARYLDELSILGVPPVGQGAHRPSSGASSSGLLLQRVDTMRESLVGGKRNMRHEDYWEQIAQTQWEEIFSRVTDSRDGDLRRIASEVYGGADDDHVASCVFGSTLTSTTAQNTGRLRETSQAINRCSKSKDRTVSTPIKVELHMDSLNSSRTAFELVPLDNGAAATITDTPVGPCRRLKMSIAQTIGESEALCPRAKVVARLFGCSMKNEVVVLSTDSLALPTVERATPQNGCDEVGVALPEDGFPFKEWRQLGSLEEGQGLVLQLGFRRLPRGTVPAGSVLLRGYSLSNAFLSQPVAAGRND